MSKCEKCGKQLGFRDKKKSFHNIMYLRAVNSGIFLEYYDKQVCISCQCLLLKSKGIQYKGLLGNTKGFERIRELINEMGRPSFEPSKQVLCSKCNYSSKYTLKVEKASLTNLMGTFTGTGSLDYQNIDKWSCSKFKFDITNRLNLAENAQVTLMKQIMKRNVYLANLKKEKRSRLSGNADIVKRLMKENSVLSVDLRREKWNSNNYLKK